MSPMELAIIKHKRAAAIQVNDGVVNYGKVDHAKSEKVVRKISALSDDDRQFVEDVVNKLLE